MTLGFVGFGNMAYAIAGGAVRSGLVEEKNVYAYDICKEKINAFKVEHDINDVDSINTLIKNCNYVVLAVKPQNYDEVLSSINGIDLSDTVFISIAAGVSIDKIKTYLGNEAKVVRAMPNTPLLLGCGATAICKCSNTSDFEFNTAISLFENSGVVSVITEDKMNEIIAVNGSSPAYLFLFAKAVCDYADKCGIDYNVAKTLFAQTMVGSAKMIMESGDDLQTLINKVTSKGGTTAKALECFYDSEFEDIIKNAMDACTKRANELGKE